MALTRRQLSSGWSFKATEDVSDGAWLSVKIVPSQVHIDLLDHGRQVLSASCGLVLV